MNEKKELIPAEVAQVNLLDKLIEKVVGLEEEQKKVRLLLEASIPEGIIEPLRPITVTSEPQTIRPPRLEKKWLSMVIVNDGPSNCFVVVNTEKSAVPYEVTVGEVYEVDMRSPNIEDVNVYTEAGITVLRVRGLR